MRNYTDFDYDACLDAEFDSDVQWTLLPLAAIEAQERAREEAIEKQRLAQAPRDHQVVLVPADSTYAPINHGIRSALQPFPEAHRAVMVAVHQGLHAYRGWRNPYPVSLAYPDGPIRPRCLNPRYFFRKQTRRSH